MSDGTLTEARPPETSGHRLGYEEALRRVMGLADFERSTTDPGHAKFHLERMGLLMERLGDPHLGVPAVHVAGTNGKGSTAAMITSALTAAGHKTGLYTSPHLHSAVERIRVGFEPISQGDYASLVDLIWPAVEWVERDGSFGPVSTFEAHTAMAFLHFKLVGADAQVLEVGLGGRLDATNVVAPEVCVVTPISLDHTATLGNTVSLIAGEKAGIIKPGVPVVVAPQSEDAMSVFRSRSSEVGAPLIDVDGELSWRSGASDADGQSFDLEGLRDTYSMWTRLLGDHQVENAATAVAALETLADRGFRLTADNIADGMRRVDWPGRLQVLSAEGPHVVVDGAHNPAAMKRLVRTVRERFKLNRVILIFGGLSGHSARGMLSEVEPLSPVIVAARSRHPRSAPSEVVADVCREAGLQVEFKSEEVGVATRWALDVARQDDLVLGTGSLSVAAEVIEEIRGMPPEVYPYITRPSKAPVVS